MGVGVGFGVGLGVGVGVGVGFGGGGAQGLRRLTEPWIPAAVTEPLTVDS
ncbi:hypothetical protein [Streptomyces sp. NBC_01262]|nr:hypothetical protein [Streptomyces sp. NBC_01262]